MGRNGVAGESQSGGVCEVIRVVVFREHTATVAG